MAAKWRLLEFDFLPPVTTQAIYHAVGMAVDKNLVPNTIIFCKPRKPLACLGYHQEMEIEVNEKYCDEKNLPLVRRILGGGAVYLDSNQLFYQVIAQKSDPRVPAKVEELFPRFLAAPTKTYNDLGVPALYRAVNDIEVGGKKISGNGAGEIGETSIVTGNIIFDFDYEEMVRILKVPSEKFRDKVSKALRERLTTLKKELREPPSEDLVRSLLKKNYEETLKVRLVEGSLTEAEMNLLEKVEEQYRQREWLYLIQRSHQELIEKRNLKISGRQSVGEAIYKAPGGLIRALVETFDKYIKDSMITGDFSFIPKEYLRELEKELKETRVAEEEIARRINHFYEVYGVQSPGMTPKDIAYAIIRASS